MATFEELLNGITDETLKANIKDAYSKVNKERGEFGSKLIEKDTKISELEGKTRTYGEAVEALKKMKIEPNQIPGILEKLNIQKTQEEEYALTKEALTTTQSEKTKLEKEVAKFKAEKVMKSFFEKERGEFKDDKGQPIKVADRFINFDKLYDVADLTNETVLKEKCKQVLTESFAEQTSVVRDIGFLGVKTQQTPEGKQIPAGQALSVKEIFEKHGPDAAIHAAREAQKQ